YRYYQNYKSTRVMQQQYWREPGKPPHIVADRQMAMAFSELHNLGGTLSSGGPLRLQGFMATPEGKEGEGYAYGIRDDHGNRFALQGASLFNDSFALEKQHITQHRTKTRRDFWVLFTTVKQFDWSHCGGPKGVTDSACTYQG